MTSCIHVDENVIAGVHYVCTFSVDYLKM